MKRRTFLLFSFFIFSKSIHAKSDSPTHFELMNAVLNHLFPQTTNYNSASQLNMINYFKHRLYDNFFDKNDLKLLLIGTKKFYSLNKNFLIYSKEQKEQALREFETLTIGQNYLSMMLYYGFEAMLGDPIYGANKNEKGWKQIPHNVGLPRPKNIYGKNNV